MEALPFDILLLSHPASPSPRGINVSIFNSFIVEFLVVEDLNEEGKKVPL